MNSKSYGRIFARAMQFRQQRYLHREQIRHRLTDKKEKGKIAARSNNTQASASCSTMPHSQRGSHRVVRQRGCRDPIGGFCLTASRGITGQQQILRIHKTQVFLESMSGPRTPTAVLELRGAFRRNPNRLKDRKYEPIVVTPLPKPSKYLTKAAMAAWTEMESWGFWLTSADQFLVAIAATLIARYRIDELKSGDVSLLIGLLGKLGFSPRERGALNLPTDTT
ncbi:hypothetical protein [Bradyrhizobium sp.]|uniref:hypothetical protein n=1 Tax=Bradyrhizobium sp. TaxID=376 RepID=UPI003BAE80BC